MDAVDERLDTSSSAVQAEFTPSSVPERSSQVVIVERQSVCKDGYDEPEIQTPDSNYSPNPLMKYGPRNGEKAAPDKVRPARNNALIKHSSSEH